MLLYMILKVNCFVLLRMSSFLCDITNKISTTVISFSNKIEKMSTHLLHPQKELEQPLNTEHMQISCSLESNSSLNTSNSVPLTHMKLESPWEFPCHLVLLSRD